MTLPLQPITSVCAEDVIFECNGCNADGIIHHRLIVALHKGMTRKSLWHSAPEPFHVQRAKCWFHRFL